MEARKRDRIRKNILSEIAAYVIVFTRSANSCCLQLLDRINIIRSDFKKCAVACLAGHYHLVDLEEAEVK
jgi:hypothetical protein